MSTTQNEAPEDGGAADLFARLPVVDEAAHERLHAQLTARAEAGQLVDVAYRTIDTPVGQLLLAATAEGLVRVAFARQGHDAVLAALAEKISPRILSTPGRLDTVAQEMDEYFAGARTRFDLPLDHRLATGFRRQVLGRLPDIGYGATASYAAVARLAVDARWAKKKKSAA